MSTRLKRQFIKSSAAALATLLLTATMGTAHAQSATPIKFQLDWRFEGPAAFFLAPVAKGYFKDAKLDVTVDAGNGSGGAVTRVASGTYDMGFADLAPVAKGYFKDAKLDVTVDAGNGSGGAVTRVASGTYDMGFADLAAVMEFHANNPDAPNKPVAVMMVYNNTPASVMSLKKSNIKSPADLNGKKLGAPGFDAGRRAFPIFAKANNVGSVNWVSMDPALRETMLAKGDIDAITGFTFTSLLNLEARGVKAEDVAIMQYPDYGVKLYGNAIIASPKLIKENPAAIKAFLAAFTKAAKEVVTNPVEGITYVKGRDGIINVALEERRLKLAIDTVINSADARSEGFGKVSDGRLSLMASQVSDAFGTKTRVDRNAIWNGSFLPNDAALNAVLPTAKTAPAKK